jgi:hypothetical protein
VGTGQTRWFEYLWAHLGPRRLSRGEWRALEALVRETATERFKNAEPTRLQMLLAACDLREAHGSMDALVTRVRGLPGGAGADRGHEATVVLRSGGGCGVV